MRRCLTVDPDARPSTLKLLEDEWLQDAWAERTAICYAAFHLHPLLSAQDVNLLNHLLPS